MDNLVLRARRWLPVAASIGLVGCSTSSAPAITLFGAYFPDWLLFALLAIFVAVMTRFAFGLAGRADTVPYPLLTCLSVGILVASAIDLLWLDR